jgi:hypothetical protein
MKGPFCKIENYMDLFAKIIKKGLKHKLDKNRTILQFCKKGLKKKIEINKKLKKNKI